MDAIGKTDRHRQAEIKSAGTGNARFGFGSRRGVSALLVCVGIACLTVSVGAEDAPAKPRTGLSFGADLYLGATNAGGVRARNNDGIWAGNGSAYPSNLAANWRGTDSDSARVSVGVGDLYTARGATLHQPVEAFYARPVGAGTVTVGKFYVPFAAQEWEYEPKWGLQYGWGRGVMQFTGSLNANTTTNAPNGYLRAARAFGTQTTLGVSGGWGRGLFSGTSHDAALGFDAAHAFKNWQFNAEWDAARSASGWFQFGFGKLTYTKGGRWTPYLGLYSWHDAVGELGNFRSVVVGTGYQIAPHLTVEAGVGRTGQRSGAFWLQSHVSL